MLEAKKICRVCGKEYKACRSFVANIDSIFRWQDVACSPECGATYLARVNASRGVVDEATEEAPAEIVEQVAAPKKTRKKKAETAVESIG